jgi:hypothetical protein
MRGRAQWIIRHSSLISKVLWILLYCDVGYSLTTWSAVWSREAKAEAARRYSPAQEAARRAAVDEMMDQNLGFFAGAMKGFMSMRESVLNGGVNSGVDGVRVGQRKRAKRWDEDVADQGLLNGATIPPERALVPVMVEADK